MNRINNQLAQNPIPRHTGQDIIEQFIDQALKKYCKGIKDRLVPDEREPGSGVLFDSTVENLADPFIFVTYHDAQAYPEYIVKFNNYSPAGMF